MVTKKASNKITNINIGVASLLISLLITSSVSLYYLVSIDTRLSDANTLHVILLKALGVH
jgi:hypothetical protein